MVKAKKKIGKKHQNSIKIFFSKLERIQPMKDENKNWSAKHLTQPKAKVVK